MGKEQSPKTDYVQEAEEFLRKNYPPKRAWVKKNLDVLNNSRERKDPESDRKIVADAIVTTIDFAKWSGINSANRDETGVVHIPSRLAAIMKFESDTHTLFKQLSLDGIVKILVIAESANVCRSINYASSDKAQHYLDNLTNLVRLHKELTGL